MAIKQTLQLKTKQNLALSPQLQQAIRLLQISSLELESEIERLLLENPLLERAENNEEFAETDQTNSNEEVDFSSPSAARSTDDEAFNPAANVAYHVSLREHLLAQLGELSLPCREKAVITLLIEELDEKGYLANSLDEIADDLPLELQLGADELAAGLLVLQQFAPTGVGARNLAESLILQLKQLNDSAEKTLALHIVAQHLELLAKHDFARLKKYTDADEASLNAAKNLISSLNPYPSSGFSAGETHYIVPDVLVSNRGGVWRARLNQRAAPNLQINSSYAQIISEQKHNSGELPAALQEAKWLIKSLAQRFDTILKVAEAIVKEQQAFFEQGEIAMKSLILRDIASQLELHESTVSRVTAQKYMLCPRGLFELKYFFSRALEASDGSECSSTSIKAQIKKIINNENSEQPLSDEAIAQLLIDNGIQIARRTVAKYREALHVPSARNRKLL